jgi:glycyl-tRNA synthetase
MKELAPKSDLMEKIVSLAKRRGFVYQGSEIYGGLAGTWDYGPLGVALKNNIKNSWRKKFVLDREDMYEVDAALLMNPKVWETSGHVGGFADPLVEDLKTQKRYRADHLLEEVGIDVQGLNPSQMNTLFKEKGIKSPKGNELGEVRQFNMMFSTKIGAMEDSASMVYFRPETAQGMFVNFKNIMDSFSPKLPFGMAQIGKAFRNEITPRDFVFRVREFEQMEIEYFIKPPVSDADWQGPFETLRSEMLDWMNAIGIDMNSVHELKVTGDDLAHYSKATTDFEFDFPFGRKELYGLAYRTDFDLKAHSEASGSKLEYFDQDEADEEKRKFIPHVIEPSFGVDRTVLALLTSAYREDEQNGEVRSYLAFKPAMAPIICAVSPLLKNKQELQDKAREVFKTLKQEFGNVMYDDNGNIGKRYRRQDEIGTPFCVVIDFDTLGNPSTDSGPAGTTELVDTVTVRDRDTGEQARMPIAELVSYIQGKISA